jgi:hypothetical protein
MGTSQARPHRVVWKRLILVIISVVAVAVFAGLLTKGYVNYISPLGAPSIDKSLIACGLMLPFVELAFLIAFAVSLIWALYLYNTLRHQDDDEQIYIEQHKHRPYEPLLASIRYDSKDANSLTEPGHYPYSFHQLAHTHKQWAQLWFTVTIAIFIGGIMYAVFNVSTHLCGVGPVANTWFVAAKVIIPNVFAYALFFIAWNWSARHFRSHWHNFIVNSYRHRALWRYEEIERKLVEIAGGVGAPQHNPAMDDTVKKIREKVADTLMELHRLSGILLLFPGDSSYSDAGSDEKAAEGLVKLEEVVRSATGGAIRP